MRNETCNKCRLHQGCENVCLTTSKQFGDLMIVGDWPSDSDDRNGALMTGKKDQLTFSILNKVIEADTSIIYKTFVVKCKPTFDDKPTKREIDACIGYLREEIKQVRPKVILLLGDVPMKALLNLSGITKERGKSHLFDIKSDEGDFQVRVIPTFSPGYVEYNQNVLKTFAEDIQLAYNYAIGVEDAPKAFTRITEVDTMDKFYELVELIKQVGICSFDYETSEVDDEGLGVHDPEFKVTLISVSFQHGSAWTIAMEHEESPFDESDQLLIWELWISEVLENEEVHKIAHNLKYEMAVSRLKGCQRILGRCDDTMLMHHLWDETIPHGLKSIVDAFYPDFQGYEDEVKREAAKNGWVKVPLRLLSPYGGTDADLTLRIRDLLEKFLLEDMRVYTIYRNLTMYLIRALFDAEWRGMDVDKDVILSSIRRAEELVALQEKKLREYKKVVRFETAKKERLNREEQERLYQKADDLQDKYDAQLARNMEAVAGKVSKKGEPKSPVLPGRKQLDEILKRISELKMGMVSYADPINFGSPPQLSDLLYSEHGFNFPKQYDRRKRQEVTSTDKKVLENLNDKSGFIADLQLYRSLTKTLATYLLGVYNRLDPESRVHTSFLIHGTTTGRLASRNPNLQNLPNIAKLTNPLAIEVTQLVKRVFVAPQGYYMVQFDYSQAELRIIADFANEETMLEAYRNKQDLHAVTGAQLMGLPLEEFMNLDAALFKKGRTNAKPANFGLIYGQSPDGYMEYAKSNYQVVMDIAQATLTRKQFFDLYPNLLVYHDLYIEKARKFGYVRTLYGRKRHLENINSSDGYIAGMDERAAINSPVQGTAGEFTEFAIALLRDRLDPRVLLCNTIHDSIIFYIPKQLMSYAVPVIRNTMEHLPNEQYFGRDLQNIEMGSDVEYSDVCWKELKPYEPEK